MVYLLVAEVMTFAASILPSVFADGKRHLLDGGFVVTPFLLCRLADDRDDT
jgi:hypothetical protein